MLLKQKYLNQRMCGRIVFKIETTPTQVPWEVKKTVLLFYFDLVVFISNFGSGSGLVSLMLLV